MNEPDGLTLGGRLIACLVVLVLTIPNFCACKAFASGSDDQKISRESRNQAALTAAKSNIEKFRKGPAHIRVIDRLGRPAENIRLEIKQISHAFKFGCYLKIDDLDQQKLPEYERRFKSLFNYAAIGTYWDNIENKQGADNWSWFDRESKLGEKLGLGIQAAPILWGTNKYGTPSWLPRPKNELLSVLEKHVRSSVTKSSYVGEWEIVNEPLAPARDLFAQTAGDEYISAAFSWAKDAAPVKRLLINEYGVFGSVNEHNYNTERYFELLDRLVKQGVPIDVIGIQAHAKGEWYEPANVAERLDHYAELGKPIQITEFSAQTLNYNDRTSPLEITGTYRDGLWDNEKQARFYREFYTIGFGNPSVEGIVTWGLDDRRAWLPGIGLIDTQDTPKQTYVELDRLINAEWKTKVDGVSGHNGEFEFRGFFGTYEVTAITSAGIRTVSHISLKQDRPNEWSIRIGSGKREN